MNKKLIFFTSRLPLNPMSGREASLYYYIKYLSIRYCFEVVVITFGKQDSVVDKPNDYISKLYTVRKPDKKEMLVNFGKMILLNRLPLQVFLFYSKRIQKQVNVIVEMEKPDILVCDMVRTSEYFKDSKIKKIFDMDDMLSIRYSRQLQSKGEIINPFGAYSKNIPQFLKAFLDSNFIKKSILKYESKSLAKYEVKMSEMYDAVILVSETERDILNNRLNIKKVFEVSTGVNCEYFSEKSVDVKKKYHKFSGGLYCST